MAESPRPTMNHNGYLVLVRYTKNLGDLGIVDFVNSLDFEEVVSRA